jgi:hypothetical protein
MNIAYGCRLGKCEPFDVGLEILAIISDFQVPKPEGGLQYLSPSYTGRYLKMVTGLIEWLVRSPIRHLTIFVA